MKSRIFALFLFTATIGAVLIYPDYRDAFARPDPAPTTPKIAVPPQANLNAQPQRPKIDAVFALDTTGSMGGLIQAAKEKIWSIATSMAQAQPAPEIRIGLVAYRDRGDSYVTRVVDLSSDLDTLYATLMDFQAEGGGDGPESVNQALADAVHKVSWNSDPNTYKVVFLVGDAPPHMDYQDDVKYPETAAEAKRLGIAVNTIQCGGDPATAGDWQRIASLGQGQYFAVAQSGGAVAVATPYDAKLAELSAQLDETRIYYGSAEEQATKQMKQAATGKLHALASLASRARRATFNATESGKANAVGDKELVDDVKNGRVDLSTLAKEQLPAPLQALPPEARKSAVEDKLKKRDALKKEIDALAAQRGDFLEKETKRLGSAKDSLDEKVYGTVREQAGKKGLRFEAAAPAY